MFRGESSWWFHDGWDRLADRQPAGPTCTGRKDEREPPFRRRHDGIRLVHPLSNEGVEGVSVAAMDLGDLGSVAAFTADIRATGSPINLIVNVAGVMASPQPDVQDP